MRIQPVKKRIVTWNEIAIYTRTLCTVIEEHFGYPERALTVHGIPRGGEVIASLMPYYGNFCTTTCDAADVIVDDIIDTGATVCRIACTLNSSACITSLFWRNTAPEPLCWAQTVETNEWLIFPWEV